MYEVYRHNFEDNFDGIEFVDLFDLTQSAPFNPEIDAENSIEDDQIVVIPHTHVDHEVTAWDMANRTYFSRLGVVEVEHATGTFLAVPGKAFRDADNEALRDDMYRVLLDGVVDPDTLHDATGDIMLRDYLNWARRELFNNIDVISALEYFEDAPNVEYTLNEDMTGVEFTNVDEVKDFIRNNI